MVFFSISVSTCTLLMASDAFVSLMRWLVDPYDSLTAALCYTYHDLSVSQLGGVGEE